MNFKIDNLSPAAKAQLEKALFGKLPVDRLDDLYTLQNLLKDNEYPFAESFVDKLMQFYASLINEKFQD